MQSIYCSLLLSFALGIPLRSEDVSSKNAILRAIPFIQKEGEQWIKDKKCVSCHQVNTMLWSLNLARERGFSVDEKLDQWIDWAILDSLRQNEKGQTVGGLNKEGVAQMLLSLPHIAEKKRDKLVDLISTDQKPDGTWLAGGQLPNQKRPKEETEIVSTMWIALAASEDAKKNAFSKIEKFKDGISTEWYALNLLFSIEFPDSNTSGHAQSLLKHQNLDGGWGWIINDTSDALATGLALYALQKVKDKDFSSEISKGRKFLLSSQRKNGSWPVKGTKQNKRKTVVDTATFWGTAWAVIALLDL